MMAAYSWQMYMQAAAMQSAGGAAGMAGMAGMPMPMPMPFMPPPMFMHPDMMSAYGYAPFDFRKRPRDWDAGSARRRRRHDNKVCDHLLPSCTRHGLTRISVVVAVTSRWSDAMHLMNEARLRSLSLQVCSNCQTNSTPFWRKDRASGTPLCNACGLYYAKNEAHRPKVSHITWSLSEPSHLQRVVLSTVHRRRPMVPMST